MALPALIAAGALTAFAVEKIGDWWNTNRGIAPQPIPTVPGQGVPSAPGAVTLVGLALLAGAGSAWWFTRKRKRGR